MIAQQEEINPWKKGRGKCKKNLIANKILTGLI